MNNIRFYVANVLTKREQEFLQLIAEGYSSEEIAVELMMKKRTVEGIRNSLLVKTASKNTASMITFGFRNGMLR